MASVVVPPGCTLEDDILKYISPVYKGGLSHCYADGYFYLDMLRRHGLTKEQLKEAIEIVKNRRGGDRGKE